MKQNECNQNPTPSYRTIVSQIKMERRKRSANKLISDFLKTASLSTSSDPQGTHFVITKAGVR